MERNDCVPVWTETKTDTQSFSSRVNSLFLRSRNWNENGTERLRSRVNGALFIWLKWTFNSNSIPWIGHQFVGDTNRLSCDPQGIPPKGLQIACAQTIYFNDVICKLASPLKTRAGNNSTEAHDIASRTLIRCQQSWKTMCLNKRLSTLSPQQHLFRWKN